GGGLIGGAAGAILLGSRNALYGLRLAEVLQPRGARTLVTAHGVIDETTAVTLAQPDAAAARLGFRATFATIYVTWNLTTLLGAIGAGRVRSPPALGLHGGGAAPVPAPILPPPRGGRGPGRGGVARAGGAPGPPPGLAAGVPVILAATAALAGALVSPRPGPA